MKELSIEEKAKCYDEALERAMNVNDFEWSSPQALSEYIFPELKESEDEKVRKELIFYLRYQYSINENFEDIGKWIAWLEKQGEHAKFRDSIQVGDKVTRNQDGVLVNLSQLKRVAKKDEKQGEQESAYTKEYDFHGMKFIPKFAKGDIIKDKKRGEVSTIKDFSYDTGLYTHTYGQFPITIQNNYEIIAQKPWSEDDETTKNIISHIIREYDKISKRENQPCWYIGDCLLWMQYIKDRVQPQPNQEWSQNDIDMIDWLIRCCEKEHEELCNDKYGHQDIVSDLKRDCRKKWNWLESLKNKVVPQNKWKPNDEQLECLSDAIKHYNSLGYPASKLQELLEDLKKLREE